MLATLARAVARGARRPPALHRALAQRAAEERAPAAGGRMRWSVHHAVVEERQPLADVFARLQREVRARGLRSAAVRQAVDTFYYHCARRADARELRDPALRAALLRFFTDELFSPGGRRAVLGESLNEAAAAAVIRLQLAWRRDARAAWALADALLAATPAGARRARLHFRTVGPILEHQCREGDVAGALAQWRRLTAARAVEWTASMEDTLVQMALACLADRQRGAAAAKGEEGEREEEEEEEEERRQRLFNERMELLLRDLRLASGEVSAANAQRLRAGFAAAGFSTRVLGGDAAMTPACAHCGAALTKLGVSEAERARLLAAIEAREPKPGAGQSAAPHLAPFREWLLAKERAAAAADDDDEDVRGSPGRLHYVLDGPNIAYINQNFDAGSCRLDQVDLVARRLLAEGHTVSITMPATYLADAFVLRIRTRKMKEQRRQGRFTTRQRSAAERAIVEAWQREGLVFSCRTDQLSDDLFWLYASVLLADRGRVVTNDRGRDHVFALLNARVQREGGAARSEAAGISMDLIERWRDQAVVNIEIRHEEVADEVRQSAAPPATPIAVEEVRLRHPLAFSRAPQRSGLDVFHLPIAPPEDRAKQPPATAAAAASGGSAGSPRARQRRKWLCIARVERAGARRSGVSRVGRGGGE